MNLRGITVPPTPNAGFASIAAGGWAYSGGFLMGYTHCLGLKVDGSVVGWGDGYYGELSAPPPNTGFIAVASGSEHSLGLKADGSIVGWGANFSGQLDVPAPNSGFVAVAAGAYHSLGLKADGSVVAWGDNEEGQCNIPLPNSGFTAISACRQSLALRANGSIEVFGGGTASVPQPNSGYIAIAAGFYHNLALRADPPLCYANCDGSAVQPLLTANDFQCFMNKFAAGDSNANCDGSVQVPILTANDFQCFMNAFAVGCS